jgi:hypothetical protein
MRFIRFIIGVVIIIMVVLSIHNNNGELTTPNFILFIVGLYFFSS